MSEPGPPATPDSDVYTILLGVASLFLLIATMIMLVRSQQFFGSWLPLGGA